MPAHRQEKMQDENIKEQRTNVEGRFGRKKQTNKQRTRENGAKVAKRSPFQFA
jgi:hypothetical protein